MYKLDGYRFYDEGDDKGIKELLLGRRVVKVNGDTMVLDNGQELEVIPNEGCCCGAGCYHLDYLETVNNAITEVELVCGDGDGGDEWWPETVYSIFVYADGIRTKLMEVSGTDGDGWYGTGYKIKVKLEEGGSEWAAR